MVRNIEPERVLSGFLCFEVASKLHEIITGHIIGHTRPAMNLFLVIVLVKVDWLCQTNTLRHTLVLSEVLRHYNLVIVKTVIA